MKFIRTTLYDGECKHPWDELEFLDSCDEIAKVNYYDDNNAIVIRIYWDNKMNRIIVYDDGPYLSTYVGTLVRISNHILVRERAMYLSLAERLQLPFNPLISQDTPNFEEVIALSKFTVTDQQEKIIQNQFIHNSDESFLQKLNNINLSNINFKIRSI